MSFFDGVDKDKILQFFAKNFLAMPAWLRNTLIVSLIVGGFYFGYVRKEIVYFKETQKTEEIYTKIEYLNKKIVKIEDIRIANEDMLYNIEEVRGITETLSELHHDEIDIVVKYVKKNLSDADYDAMRDELDAKEKDYRSKVNDMFERKAKDHLSNSKDREE